ncbi:DnaB-like helicase C-terminal domain-containing protein [Rhodococcus qingshengii]|uniref:replicative DNA helicase n=1 Tax=Rhodococcus TaxID=1827 RepID=UPI001E599536|nr:MULTISPECIES: DnaB-like helicase C-terminal domain-containing protein [Rhodococcus]MCD2099617.1 toprim domain-containing protein [Rhodococcus rhodochrous]MCD2123985.1 toprim domain-containing protein [Rhodococcus rhodochrous]MCQ4136582.1 toprim domain-containing protein [Rhodococcus rhodochrous]MDJ0490631.1 DnaB-like helicase C-terminal domain-containing protein [Rhodococcus qingshengii]
MNTTAYDRVLDAFRSQGLIVQEKRDGVADCQAPGHSDRDRSVRVTRTEGQTLVCCFSDPTDQVLDTLGLRYSDLFDNPKGVKYEYDDGRIVVRSPDKDFKQYGNKQGNSLYRVNRAVEAISNGRPVFLTEGEKDVHAIEAAGGIAACTAMGAGKAKMFDFTPLRGGTITIVADKDEAGEKHAREVAATLLGLDCTVSIVNAAEGKDAADHIAAGNLLDGFIARDDLTAEARLDHILATATAMRDGKSAAAVADQLARNLAKLNETTSDTSDLGNFQQFDTILEEWLEWVDAPLDLDSIVPTPWQHVNDALGGGLRPQALYLCAARPGHGKTVVGVNIAQHAAELGIPTGVLSLEMSNMQIASRIMSAGGEVHASQIREHNLDEHNQKKLGEYVGRIQGRPLYVSDQATINEKQIRRQVATLVDKYGIKLLVVDYLQLMNASDTKTARQEQLSAISRELKLIAKDFNIAVFAAAQLNRDSAKENRPPVVADLRGSGSLEQDADVVILLHHETEADGTPTGMVDFILGKVRDGAPTTISLPWRPHVSKVGGGNWT